MRVSLPILFLILVTLGCNATPRDSRTSDTPGNAGANRNTTNAQPQAKPIAYVDGQNVRVTDLEDELLELAGGTALREHVLDTALRERLDRRGITLGPGELQAEKQRLLSLLGADANQATRLLRTVRERRGLGEVRFEQFLWRNAALRVLTAEQVELGEADIRRAFSLRYGQRYRVRLIVVSNVAEAARVRRELEGGTPFFQAAIDRSSDESAARGGLLPPIHPDDPTYPAAVRQVLPRLQPGQVSRPIALDQGVALVKLESTVPGQSVSFASVRDALERDVRLEAEEQRMRQLALSLVDEADVLILSPALQAAWDRAERAAPAAP